MLALFSFLSWSGVSERARAVQSQYMNTLDSTDIIPVLVLGEHHIVTIIAKDNGRYLSTWDDRPILYPQLDHGDRLSAFVEAVASLAASIQRAHTTWIR